MTAGLVPVCHATRRDSGSLCAASLFSDRSRSCRSTYTWMKTAQLGGGGVTACTCTTVLPSWQWDGGHMEGKGLSSKGKLHARYFQTMNKFTSNQQCHSLTEQIFWRRWVTQTFWDKRMYFIDWPKHISIILSSPFSSGNMIIGNDEGETGQSQREKTFNLRAITKEARKTALDGRMPLGRRCCYYVGRGSWAAVWVN